MINKKLILMCLIFVISIVSVSAIEVCFNTTGTEQICTNSDSDIFPQTINLYEGNNDIYGLYITNPTDSNFESNLILNSVKGLIDDNKIDVSQLSDNMKFEFKSYSDFYNILQQSNAIGNVSLFTKSELNQKNRDKTLELSAKNISWTVTIIVVIMELVKMIMSILLILLTMFVFFRLIPLVLKHLNKLIFKLAVGTKK